MKRSTVAMIVLQLAIWARPAAAQLVQYGPPYTAAGGFLAPTGLGVDETHGLLFVADTGNQRLKYTPIAALTGAPAWSELGYVPDPAAAAALDGPQGVAADVAGNVYAVDTFAGEVQLYRYDAGTATYAYDPAFASATRHTVAGVPITFPRDVAVGADGRVYLLDSGNGRVLVADGPSASAWSVWHADPTWLNPYGLDVARDGTVYVADTGNNRIVRIAPDGTSAAIGGYGTGGGQFRGPRDVAAGEDGRLFVADTLNHRVSVLNSDGSFAGHLAVAPLVASPQKVCVDARNRVFVVDSDMARVVAFLGATVPRPFDLYVRDDASDAGAEPSTGTLASPDIVIRRSPDIDVASANSLDGYTSEQPIVGLDAYVYVAVHNSGSAVAHDTVLNAYWAYHDGPLTFPNDWHADGLQVLDATGQRIASHSLPVPEIPARSVVNGVAVDGVRVVGPFVWSPSAWSNSFDLLVRILNPFDAITTGGTGREAAVHASNNVAMRSTVLTDELPDGDFVADLSGELYVEILYSKASYANYFVITDPAPAAPATCDGFSVPSCFFETAQCRSRCHQDSNDISCACLANELKYVGHVERGQRIASQLHSDKGRDGTIDYVYSSKPALNGDGFDHLRTFKIYPGAWVLEWEDGWGGGDRDFNDMVVLVRIVAPDTPQRAAQLAGTPLSYVTNVVLEDRSTTANPKLRMTALLQNPSDAPQRVAVCPRVALDPVYNVSASNFSYSAGSSPPPGTPVHVWSVSNVLGGVALSKEQRAWNAPGYVYDPPLVGDQVTVPARTAAGPGQAAIEYEVELSAIDRELADDHYSHIHFADKPRDQLRQVIAQKGVATWLFTSIAPEKLLCPSGAMSVFSGDAGGIAVPSFTTTYPFSYNIASPAHVTVPTVTPQMEASGGTVVGRLEFFWTDNLPVHLRGHIVSDPPERNSFIVWPSARREVPVTLNFGDDIPETFWGKLETIVRDANSGAVLLTATNVFTKDHTPPTFAPLHTERAPDRIEVTAKGDGGPSGLASAALVPNVDGSPRDTVYMKRIAGDFTGPTELEATVAPVGDLERVAVDLQAADGAGNEASHRLPIASTGGDLRLECSAVGGSWIDLDGTRSTAAADVSVDYAWTGPFGAASGATPHVFFPLGASSFALQLADGRGYTGREASVATIVDTTPPSLTVTATPTCLWPPNHKFVPLRLGENMTADARDVCDPAPRVRVVRVEANEHSNGLGDGNTRRDVIFGDAGVCLRSERSGLGKDRVYRVVIEATDASGNATEAVLQVKVPHDQGHDRFDCPALPPEAFAEEGDPRCDFAANATPSTISAGVSTTTSPPSDAASGTNDPTRADSPGVRKTALASCATAPFGTGIETILPLLPLLLRRTVRRRGSARPARSSTC